MKDIKQYIFESINSRNQLEVDWNYLDNKEKLYIKLKASGGRLDYSIFEGTYKQIVAYLYTMALQFGDHLPQDLKELLAYDAQCRKAIKGFKGKYTIATKGDFDKAASEGELENEWKDCGKETDPHKISYTLGRANIYKPKG